MLPEDVTDATGQYVEAKSALLVKEAVRTVHFCDEPGGPVDPTGQKYPAGHGYVVPEELEAGQ